jgi:predicted Zn-dependent peptidase
LIQEMCRGELYARPSIGHVEEIRALTLDSVRKSHQQLIESASVDVFLVGDVTLRDARRFAKSLGLAPRRPVRLRRTERKRPARARTVREREDIAQAKLAMGFRTRLRPDAALLPALMLMNSLFGGTPVGKLFKVVREQESLCYSIGSMIERTKGLLLVHAGIDSAHYAKARRLILKQLDELKQGRVAEESFAQAHGMLLSGFQSLRDSPSALIDFALERTTNKMPADLDGLLQRIEKVTVQEVARAARSVELDTVYLLGK